MNFFEKRRWNRLLKDCDYNLAASVLTTMFKGGVIKKELAMLLDDYLSNPCLETAVAIIKFAPKDFIIIFHECKLGGHYTRHSLKNNTENK